MATPLDGNPLSMTSAIAAELEKVTKPLYQQFMADNMLNELAPPRPDIEVSGRLVRMPVAMQPGTTFAQFDPNSSASLGTGGGEQLDVAVATPVYFVEANSITKAAEWTSRTDTQAIVNLYKNQFKAGTRDFKANISRLLSASTGAGDLGTLTATPGGAATSLNVSDANNFQAGVQYGVWSGIGGTYRGNILVLSIDSAANVVYLSQLAGQYFPAGTTSGDTLIIAGAAGSATSTYSPDRYTSATVASSLNGIPAIVYNSSTGSWFGIPRSTWPGILNSVHTAAGSAALGPADLQLLESLLLRYAGTDGDALGNIKAHTNVDQLTAWENVGLYTNTTSDSSYTAFTNKSAAGEGGDSRPDFLNAKRVKTVSGKEIILNLYALPGRLDLVNFKKLFRIEILPIQPLDDQGVTAFMQRSADGGVAPITLFYFVTGLQVMTESARAHAYRDGLAIPTGF